MKLRTLQDAQRYLESFINLERQHDFDYERLGLGRIRALLDSLGHPESGLPCVHIAGSKGKGSVAWATERLLAAAGQRVGTYTSPHLECWTERFRIDGRSVGVAPLLQALREIAPVAERLRCTAETCPSFFDISTALALLLFARAEVEVGVIEVGLGGRLDSTNIVESRVSVLTAIQLEHTDKLGSTLYEIALEKAGILRPGVPLVYGPLPQAALGAVLARAVVLDTPVEAVRATAVEHSERGLVLRLEDGRVVASRILGRHQADNLALAVRAAEHFLDRALSSDELTALADLSLPARIERRGHMILDCAHTPDSVRVLRETLQELWPDRSWTLVLSVSRDKDAAGILSELAPLTRIAVLTRAEPLRSHDPGTLRPLAWASGIEKVELCADPQAALACARRLRAPDDGLLVTGSIYLAGEIRSRLG